MPKMINFAHNFLKIFTKPKSNFTLGHKDLLQKVILINFYLLLTF